MHALSTKIPAYAKFLSPVSARRKPSAIRALQPLVGLPGMISLGGGMPNAKFFPFKSIDFTLQDGSVLKSTDADVKEALQYSPTPGISELVARLKVLQEVEHAPKQPFTVAVIPGSQDGLTKIFDMLIHDQSDNVLVEGPTYSGTLAYLEPKGCGLITVKTDHLGLNPENMRNILDNWDTTKSGKKPRLLYTIPTGSNPTGASMNLERRIEVLKIAQEHDLLIVEDDPYYYMQYAPERVPSLFSLDPDGRVIRTDSLSKIVSSGIRVGFVSGPSELVDAMSLHNQASIMHASGLSQLAVLMVLRWMSVGDPDAKPETAGVPH